MLVILPDDKCEHFPRHLSVEKEPEAIEHMVELLVLFSFLLDVLSIVFITLL
jgi:hypothetical protein